MFFYFLNFIQCIVCMFVHTKIDKVTNLKVHSKERYSVFKMFLFLTLILSIITPIWYYVLRILLRTASTTRESTVLVSPKSFC